MDALAWLNVLDAIRETIPDEYEIKRLDWRRELIDQHMPQCTRMTHGRTRLNQLGSRTASTHAAV